ncbi:MAG: hypothetical protein K2Y37_18445 [Pirellulales bacterium]|nr:hypothetical protein [Pirellulales bacterium]
MPARSAPGLSPAAVLLVALSLSIGWGVRGNWGHEFGAMIPGALAALAAVVCSGRDDWYRRAPYFAFLGAVGWSFGGTISYMQVIGFTHNGEHAGSVLYGFACLFVIGFLWGAPGGAGTALPAFVDRTRLTGLFVPVIAVFLCWLVQALFFMLADTDEEVLAEWFRPEVVDWLLAHRLDAFDWYDTDWIAALVALVAAGGVIAVQRRAEWGTRLVIYLAVGWWLGFTILTVNPYLNLRMTPPRGDSWAGMVGFTVALLAFLMRERLWGVAWAALVAGVVGGIGFSGATMLKLIEVHPDVQRAIFGQEVSTNWHSVLEQTYGFINGLGIAIAMGVLSARAPRLEDEPRTARWTETFSVAFVLLAITYLNIRKNVHNAWLENHVVPDEIYGFAAQTWFEWAYLVLAAAVLVLLVARHRGREISLVPIDWLGRGQLLYVIFLWWVVVGNLSRVLPFAPQRLITEGVIHVNACLCTILVLLVPSRGERAVVAPQYDYRALWWRTAIGCAVLSVAVVFAEYGTVRGLWGDTFAGQGGKHIRFGPNATVNRPRD